MSRAECSIETLWRKKFTDEISEELKVTVGETIVLAICAADLWGLIKLIFVFYVKRWKCNHI